MGVAGDPSQVSHSASNSSGDTPKLSSIVDRGPLQRRSTAHSDDIGFVCGRQDGYDLLKLFKSEFVQKRLEARPKRVIGVVLMSDCIILVRVFFPRLRVLQDLARLIDSILRDEIL